MRLHKTTGRMTDDGDAARERYLRSFGDRLRELRKARHLRQVDMVLFDLNYKYYQRLESGQVNPTLFTLYKIATALEVSVRDLF